MPKFYNGTSPSIQVNNKGWGYPFQHVGSTHPVYYGSNAYGNNSGGYYGGGYPAGYGVGYYPGLYWPAAFVRPAYQAPTSFDVPLGFGKPHIVQAPQQVAAAAPAPEPAPAPAPEPPKPVTLDVAKLGKAEYATGHASLDNRKDAFVSKLTIQLVDQLKAQGIDGSTPEGSAKLASMDFNADVTGSVSRLPYTGEKSDGQQNRQLGVNRGSDYAAMLAKAAANAGFSQDRIHITSNTDPAKTVIPDASHLINPQSDRTGSARSITLIAAPAQNVQATASAAADSQPAITVPEAQANAMLNERLANAGIVPGYSAPMSRGSGLRSAAIISAPNNPPPAAAPAMQRLQQTASAQGTSDLAKMIAKGPIM